MQEEVEALRSMLKEYKAKADRYEATLMVIAAGPQGGEGDFADPKEHFADQAQTLAKAALG